MSPHVRIRWEAILAVAEGGLDESLTAHISSCTECTEALRDARTILSASALKMEDAPRHLVQRAGRVFESGLRRPRLSWASWTAAEARSVVSERLQAVFELDEVRVRVQTARRTDGWDVMVEVEPPTARILTADGPVELDEQGRTSFGAVSPGAAAFRVVAGGRTVHIPSILETDSDFGPGA